MKHFACAKICLATLAATVLTTGCLNSEGEYNQLTEERDALAEEVTRARQENEILTAALKNIEEEKARLAAALKPYQPALAAGDAAGAPPATPTVDATADAAAQAGATGETTATEPAAPPTNPVHVAQRGDTLSNIATRYSTDMQTLLNLNPYLLRRNDYMVWENDNIQLPATTAPPAPAEVF